MKNIKIYFEVFVVDLIAKKLWWIVYPFIKGKLSRRCKECVLNENFTSLNEQQICEYCENKDNTNVLKSGNSSQDYEVDKIIGEYVKKGSRWDALVLFSGGKDSSFLLWKLNELYPELRVLALLVNTGFMSPVALENAENVIKKFNVDFITHQPNPKFTNSVFKFGFQHIQQQKNYSVVDLLDGQIIFDSARNMATSFDIPIIICGLAKNQVENVYGDVGFEFTEEQEVNPVESQLKISLNEAFSEEENLYWYNRNNLKGRIAPRFLLPMVEWDYSEEQIVKTVEKQNLIEEKHSSPLLTNNALIPLISVAEINLRGYTSFEVEFAKTIREGKASRKYWLRIFQLAEYSAITGRLLSKSADRVLSQLGLRKIDLGLK